MTSGAVFASRAAGVRLPPAYTLGIAMAGTLLVLAGLLFVFSRRVATPLTWPRMLLHVVQAPSVVPAPSPQRPARPVIRSSSARTIALPQPLKANVLQDLPAPAASNLDLSVGIPAPTVPLPAGIGSYPFNPYSDLNRALDAPPKAPILKNGQTLGLVGFPAIAKIAGHVTWRRSCRLLVFVQVKGSAS